MSPAETLKSLDHELHGIALVLDSLVANHDTDLDTVASAILLLDDMQREIKLLRDRAVQRVAAHMPSRVHQMAGKTFQRMKATNRKGWQHREIAGEVARRALARSVDADGVRVLGEGEAIAEALLECAGISYWRKGACTELEIDVDEYCQVEDQGWSLKIT